MRTIYIKLYCYIVLLIVYGLYFDIKFSGKKYKAVRINLLQI